MASLTLPLPVVENISRAKSLLRRDEPLRGIDALVLGLNLYEPSSLASKARFEAEVIIDECMNEFNVQKDIKKFLESIAGSSGVTVSYKPGQEKKLKETLTIIRKALEKIKQDKKNQEKNASNIRRDEMIKKGECFLADKEFPRATSTFRVLADEFGHEEGLFVKIGELLKCAELKFEATEFFEKSIEKFPADSRAYQGATSCCMDLREFEKAVEVYLKALRQFGNHPRTLLNLAKAYELSNNRGKAFEYAMAAYQADPSNKEAKEMADKYS